MRDNYLVNDQLLATFTISDVQISDNTYWKEASNFKEKVKKEKETLPGIKKTQEEREVRKGKVKDRNWTSVGVLEGGDTRKVLLLASTVPSTTMV